MRGGFERWAKTPRFESPINDADFITFGVAIFRTVLFVSADLFSVFADCCISEAAASETAPEFWRVSSSPSRSFIYVTILSKIPPFEGVRFSSESPVDSAPAGYMFEKKTFISTAKISHRFNPLFNSNPMKPFPCFILLPLPVPDLFLWIT